MEVKDILRIALFFLIAIYAFHPSILAKIKNISLQNIKDENEEKEKQQKLQKRRDDMNRTNQERIEYGNEMTEKTKVSV